MKKFKLIYRLEASPMIEGAVLLIAIALPFAAIAWLINTIEGLL